MKNILKIIEKEITPVEKVGEIYDYVKQQLIGESIKDSSVKKNNLKVYNQVKKIAKENSVLQYCDYIVQGDQEYQIFTNKFVLTVLSKEDANLYFTYYKDADPELKYPDVSRLINIPYTHVDQTSGKDLRELVKRATLNKKKYVKIKDSFFEIKNLELALDSINVKLTSDVGICYIPESNTPTLFYIGVNRAILCPYLLDDPDESVFEELK